MSKFAGPIRDSGGGVGEQDKYYTRNKILIGDLSKFKLAIKQVGEGSGVASNEDPQGGNLRKHYGQSFNKDQRLLEAFASTKVTDIWVMMMMTKKGQRL